MSNVIISDDVELNILIEGDDPLIYTINIKIPRSAKFGTLVGAIQSTYRQRRSIDITDLKLFKFNRSDEELEHIQFSNEIPLSTRRRVESIWPPGSSINDDLIHIVVQCRVPSTSTEKPSTSPANDELGELAESFKRAQIAFVKGLSSQSSATAAEPKKFRQQQATTNYIRNGRPATRTGLPIVLYHPVFGRFLSNLRSTAPISSAIYTQTTRYFTVSQELYEAEFDQRPTMTARDQSSQEGLQVLLGSFMSRVSMCGTRPDGLASGHGGACLIVVEMKNEIGTGGSDPSIQAAQSYSRYWGDPKMQTLLDQCCCPSLLVAIAGPWMAILGAVFLDRPVVQPLTHFLWIGHDPARPSELEYLARVFHCISSARGELEEFYRNVPTPRSELDRFLPYITHYTDPTGHRVQFAYLKALSGTRSANNKSIFLAETRGEDPPKKIVIKFVRTYNADAHNLLAKAGLAPLLLYDGTSYPQDQPGPDHAMVVMEFVGGVDLAKFDGYPLPDSAPRDIDRALKCLHDHDFVFGDLRDPNVMIVTDSSGMVTGAKLVDFDWCGTHHVGRYPVDMNPDIIWADGVGPRTLMDKRHDVEMRGRLNLRR
ncbi:hypothetical protein FS749_003688 [Ceratobasidium sp. UAMH 11750]|nr:hypothetical protein FS749_003688 [Ceratobasidium sp. UAMH 11750]